MSDDGDQTPASSRAHSRRSSFSVSNSTLDTSEVSERQETSLKSEDGDEEVTSDEESSQQSRIGSPDFPTRRDDRTLAESPLAKGASMDSLRSSPSRPPRPSTPTPTKEGRRYNTWTASEMSSEDVSEISAMPEKVSATEEDLSRIRRDSLRRSKSGLSVRPSPFRKTCYPNE